MDTSLDLSKVDPPVWRVLIKSTAYGPYTLGQLQGFIEDGRIGLQTKVAKGDGAAFIAAETIPELQPALRKKFINARNKGEEDRPDTPHNYIIITKLSGGDGASQALMQAINSFGSFGEAMPGIFVLRSKVKLSTIQKALNAAVSSKDRVLIVDATSNRLGWFNLGPEADVHLRSIWDKG